MSRANDMNDLTPKLAIAGGILLFVLFIAVNAVFTVREGQQALVLQFGEVRQQITQPGIAFKIPFIQQTRFFESRVLNVDPPSEEILLSDQKRIVVDTFARYRIRDMLKYFQTLGSELAATQRMNNIINSAMRSTLGKAPLTNILSEKRSALMSEIQAAVNEETTRFGIEVVDVRIVRADLPAETSQSIFARMRTEREREAKEARAEGAELAQQIRSSADKERSVLLAEAERDAQIIRGEGDKQAIKIYGDAFSKDAEFYAFYRSLEAYRNSLANPDTMMILSPDSDFFRYLENRRGQ